METYELSRCVLSMSFAIAVLSACGAPSMPIGPADDANLGTNGVKNKKTFYYTGKEQTFVVPTGVKQLTVTARGGEGAGVSYYPSTDPPGFPGRVYAIIRVHPGEKVYVFVGGSGAHGGFNGGGAGGTIGSYGSQPGNPGGEPRTFG